MKDPLKLPDANRELRHCEYAITTDVVDETQQKQLHPPGRGRILIPALIAWACTAGTLQLPNGGWILLGCSGGSAFLLILAAWKRHPTAVRFLRLSGMSCALLMLVGVVLTTSTHHRTSEPLQRAAASHQVITLTAHTHSYPREVAAEHPLTWVRATVSGIGSTAPVPVLVFLAEPAPTDWALGTTLKLTGTLQAAPPGADHAYVMNVTKWQHSTGTHRGAFAPHQMLSEWAVSLRAGVTALAATVPGAELVPGFAVGETNGVSTEVTAQLTATSLTHLTAVSGANCAIVTGASLWILQRMRVPRRARIVAAGLALIGFAVIVGPDASLQRAAVMGGVILVSQFSGQAASAYPALGLAITVLLMVNPWNALSPGFALSVCATLGILCGAQPLNRWLHRTARLPAVLTVPLSLTFLAQLACTPVLLLLQSPLSLISVFANLCAGPVAPVITVLGLAATLLNPVAPTIAAALMVLASYPARWVMATARVCAELPIPPITWPRGWIGVTLFMIAAISILLSWALSTGNVSLCGRHRHPVRLPWHAKPARPVMLSRAIRMCLATGISVILAVTGATPLATRIATPHDWVVVACDIGQGDAFLFRDPEHTEHTILLDTGDEPELLQACIERFGVTHISLLILSHDDRDHVGALSQIIHMVDTALIAPPTTDQISAGRPVQTQLTEAHVRTLIGTAGHTLKLSNRMSLSILAPQMNAALTDTNAASQVIMLTLGTTRILLLGDTGESEQRALIDHTSNLHADIVKIAHHGSRDQARALAEAVGAQWALVSVGAENTYGHPAAQTVTDYETAGTRVLRTDEQGSIALSPNQSFTRMSDPLTNPPQSFVPWVTGKRE